MQIKLIALDIDGTLLNSNLEVTAATIDALNRAMERGIHIVLSTGRLVVECEDILEKLPCIRYVNSCTGAEVVDLQTGKTVAGRRIEGDEILRLYELLKDLDLMPCAFDPVDGMAHCSVEKFRLCMENCSPDVARHLRRFYCPEEDFEAYLRSKDSLIKYYMPCFNERAITDVAQRMKEEPYTVVQCGPSDMEIIPVGTDKGLGLQLLAQALGLEQEQVMAIGDSENDIGMLRYAGLPVVMGNGLPHVKELARYITDDNDHDGVAKAINMVLEGKL